MHPFCNINTSTNLYDPSRALEDYYYYYSSSPSLFPSSPSLHHPYLQGDGANNIEADFFQDLLENHHEIMIQQQQNPVEDDNSNTNNNTNDNNDKSKRVGIEKISSPRKKVSKKDRHTKIETAQGPRDRRMRLSLNIARRFFDLQDMLGFDKASKTVEWLLTKSISAITELSTSIQQQACANSSLSSTSEIVMDELSSSMEKGMPNIKNSEPKKPNKKVVRTIRPLTKKSREKARERARERTKEKMQKRRQVGGTTHVVGHGTSLLASPSWVPSSTFLNLQQNDGLIHGLTSPELEPLSGNLGEASIW